MKKWIARPLMAAVISATLLSSVSLPVFADSATILENPAQNLALAGLFGNIAVDLSNKDKTITRGEFAQMLVNASIYKDSEEKYISASLFKDVKADNQNIGAIKIAVNAGWLSSYLDGTFRPDNGVTLRDAAKSLVSVLGYTNQDFTGNITNAQLSKFYELELDEHITKTAYEYLTVGDCINLFYNLLNTKTKTGTIYAQVIGYNVTSEGNVALLSVLKDELDGPIVATNAWKTELPFEVNSSTTYFRNDFAAQEGEIRGDDILYYSSDLNMVYAYHDVVIGKIDAVYPNALQAESLVIDGNTYKIENDSIRNEIATWTEDALDKSVVLLAGMDKEVVKMLDLWDYSKNVCTGIISKLGYRDGDYYIEVTRSNGKPREITYDPDDITLTLNDIVTVVTYEGENYVSKVSTAANIAKLANAYMKYDTDDDEYRLGKYYFHRNSNILCVENGEYIEWDAEDLFESFEGNTREDGDYEVCREMFMAKYQVLYVNFSSSNEITSMIVVPMY